MVRDRLKGRVGGANTSGGTDTDGQPDDEQKRVLDRAADAAEVDEPVPSSLRPIEDVQGASKMASGAGRDADRPVDRAADGNAATEMATGETDIGEASRLAARMGTPTESGELVDDDAGGTDTAGDGGRRGPLPGVPSTVGERTSPTESGELTDGDAGGGVDDEGNGTPGASDRRVETGAAPPGATALATNAPLENRPSVPGRETVADRGGDGGTGRRSRRQMSGLESRIRSLRNEFRERRRNQLVITENQAERIRSLDETARRQRRTQIAARIDDELDEQVGMNLERGEDYFVSFTGDGVDVTLTQQGKAQIQRQRAETAVDVGVSVAEAATGVNIPGSGDVVNWEEVNFREDEDFGRFGDRFRVAESTPAGKQGKTLDQILLEVQEGTGDAAVGLSNEIGAFLDNLSPDQNWLREQAPPGFESARRTRTRNRRASIRAVAEAVGGLPKAGLEGLELVTAVSTGTARATGQSLTTGSLTPVVRGVGNFGEAVLATTVEKGYTTGLAFKRRPRRTTAAFAGTLLASGGVAALQRALIRRRTDADVDVDGDTFSLRAELDPRIGPFGRTLEAKTLTRLFGDERGMARLTGRRRNVPETDTVDSEDVAGTRPDVEQQERVVPGQDDPEVGAGGPRGGAGTTSPSGGSAAVPEEFRTDPEELPGPDPDPEIDVGSSFVDDDTDADTDAEAAGRPEVTVAATELDATPEPEVLEDIETRTGTAAATELDATPEPEVLEDVETRTGTEFDLETLLAPEVDADTATGTLARPFAEVRPDVDLFDLLDSRVDADAREAVDNRFDADQLYDVDEDVDTDADVDADVDTDTAVDVDRDFDVPFDVDNRVDVDVDDEDDEEDDSRRGRREFDFGITLEGGEPPEAPGYLAETLTDYALGVSIEGRELADDADEFQPFGEFETEELAAGGPEIAATLDIFGFGGDR